VRRIIRAARLFDGRLLLEHAWVLIEDGNIVAVEHGASEAPGDVDTVELGDATLLPGLIDPHVHLGFDASRDPVAQMRADSDAVLLLRMRHAAEKALAAGITTVRDLGDRNYLGTVLRDWFRSGPEPGPEIIAAGPPVTVTGGHCWFMGGEADGELEVRRAVRAHVKAGADVLKIMATGGHMTHGTNPALPQFSVAEVRAAVDEAHRLGRAVTAHAHGPAGIAVVVEAGVDCIEHCSFRVDGGRAPDSRLIEAIAARGIFVSPTVGTLGTGGALIESFLPILAEMHAAGVRLVASTDAGISPLKPHDVLPHGIVFLTRAGLSNAEALTAATSVAAEACGVADRVGTIDIGKTADLLAVQGDPLRDISAIHNVRAVFRRGEPVVP
jgi:imidazolonepropionase-like amidohydrolase